MGILDIVRLRRAGRRGGEHPLIEASEYARYIKPPILPSRERPVGEVVERYVIYDPWVYIHIILSEDTGEYVYYVDEVPLTADELKVYRAVVDFLIWEAGELREGEDPREFISREIRRAVELYRARVGGARVSWSKIMYYVERDIAGFGPINALMLDPNLEDISCNGIGIPVYVYHRKYESMPTNIVFNAAEDLDAFLVKLAHMAGKHISVAFPILDASLPGGHRLAATFMKEVSQKGSTFTIRKFREDPITIVDMIDFGTVSPLLAAYLWIAIEHKKTILITGVTGSGKTTLLNSILNLVKPNYKIVTIEETPEIRLPTKNWVQLVSRPSYAAGESKASEIGLYDLVRVSLRYRPDIIVVGEVRGAEAYVLFQSIATGHGGATTIHAENIEAAIKRLTSPPMNIPESYIPLINIALLIERISVRDREGRARTVRRVTRVWEISREGIPELVSKWSPLKDAHEIYLENSQVLKSIAAVLEVDVGDMVREVYRRATIMEWLHYKGVRNYKDIAHAIYRYYRNPLSILERAEADLKVKRMEGGSDGSNG